MQTIFESKNIKVIELVDEDGDVQRQLFLGPPFQNVQGAIKTARSKYHVHEFTRNLTYGALYVPGAIADALFLGLGAGVTIQAVRDLAPSANIDIVEINPELFAVSNDFFFRLDSKNVKCISQDAFAFLKNARKKYDYVCCDVWGNGLEIPDFLLDEEFLSSVQGVTNSGGVFSINTHRFLHKPLSEALVKRFRFVLSLKGFNCLLLAMNEPPKLTSDQKTVSDMLSRNIDIELILANSMALTAASGLAS